MEVALDDFFWVWWAPFVGLFIARISRSRTLREFVLGVMFVPLGFIFAWFSIFGNSAINLVNQGAESLGKIALNNPPMGLFTLFEHYPASWFWSSLALALGLIFFIISGALVLANLSSTKRKVNGDASVG